MRRVESGDFQALPEADQITAESVGALEFRHRGSPLPGDGGESVTFNHSIFRAGRFFGGRFRRGGLLLCRAAGCDGLFGSGRSAGWGRLRRSAESVRVGGRFRLDWSRRGWGRLILRGGRRSVSALAGIRVVVAVVAVIRGVGIIAAGFLHVVTGSQSETRG